MSVINKDKYMQLTEKSFYKKLGKVTKIVGLTIESIGPDAKLNDLCKITSSDGRLNLYAEVVGFNDSRVLLMPFESVDGIGPGCIVGVYCGSCRFFAGRRSGRLVFVSAGIR